MRLYRAYFALLAKYLSRHINDNLAYTLGLKFVATCEFHSAGEPRTEPDQWFNKIQHYIHTSLGGGRLRRWCWMLGG